MGARNPELGLSPLLLERVFGWTMLDNLEASFLENNNRTRAELSSRRKRTGKPPCGHMAFPFQVSKKLMEASEGILGLLMPAHLREGADRGDEQ